MKILMKPLIFVILLAAFSVEAAVTAESVAQKIEILNKKTQEFLNQKKISSDQVETQKEDFIRFAHQIKSLLIELRSTPSNEKIAKELSIKFTDAVMQANLAERTSVGFLSDKKHVLISAHRAFKLVDFFVISQSQVGRLLNNYRVEVATSSNMEPGVRISPIGLQDLNLLNSELQSQQINESGYRAWLGLAQSAHEPASFELARGLKTEWQLKALRLLIDLKYNQRAYLDEISQRKYIKNILFAENAEKFEIFAALIQAENFNNPLNEKFSAGSSYIENFMKDSEVLRLQENNVYVTEVLSLLTSMPDLLENLNLNHRTSFIQFLSKINNAHQVAALKAIADAYEKILPKDIVKATVETYERKMPFTEKLGDFFFGIDTTYLYGKKTRTHLSYGTSTENVYRAHDLMNQIALISSEQDKSDFFKLLAQYGYRSKEAKSCSLVFKN